MIFSVHQYLSSLIDVTGSRRVWGSTCCSCIVSCCIQATMEEAEGRHITNKLMLRQLQMLRERMYKGFYLLDTFMYQVLQQHGDNDQVSGYPLSIFCRAKRLCFSTRGMNVSFQVDGVKEVQKMLESLQSIIVDMAEFIVFLKLYPPINRETSTCFWRTACLAARLRWRRSSASCCSQSLPAQKVCKCFQ